MIHPLGVAVRPEGEEGTQREVCPRLVAGVAAGVAPPESGELLAVLCPHRELEEVLVVHV
jgi:hypothetical protein